MVNITDSYLVSSISQSSSEMSGPLRRLAARLRPALTLRAPPSEVSNEVKAPLSGRFPFHLAKLALPRARLAASKLAWPKSPQNLLPAVPKISISQMADASRSIVNGAMQTPLSELPAVKLAARAMRFVDNVSLALKVARVVKQLAIAGAFAYVTIMVYKVYCRFFEFDGAISAKIDAAKCKVDSVVEALRQKMSRTREEVSGEVGKGKTMATETAIEAKNRLTELTRKAKQKFGIEHDPETTETSPVACVKDKFLSSIVSVKEGMSATYDKGRTAESGTGCAEADDATAVTGSLDEPDRTTGFKSRLQDKILSSTVSVRARLAAQHGTLDEPDQEQKSKSSLSDKFKSSIACARSVVSPKHANEKVEGTEMGIVVTEETEASPVFRDEPDEALFASSSVGDSPS